MADKADVDVLLPRSRCAPSAARHALRRSHSGDVDPNLLADAELLVGELVSNAVLHGRGTIILRARLDDDRLYVEVIDEGSGFERELRRHDFEQVGGWGLDIVDDVASRWGVHA